MRTIAPATKPRGSRVPWIPWNRFIYPGTGIIKKGEIMKKILIIASVVYAILG